MISRRSNEEGLTLLEVAMAAILTISLLVPLMYAYNHSQRSFRAGNQELKLSSVGAEVLDELTRKLYYGKNLWFAPTPFPSAGWSNALSASEWPRFACALPSGNFVMVRYSPLARTLETKTSAASDDLNVNAGWGSLPLAGQPLGGLLANHESSFPLTEAQRLPFRFTDAHGQVLAFNSATSSRRVEIRLLLSNGSSPPLFLRTSIAPRNIPHF